MKHKWAPWRMEYIMSPETDRCIFCDNDEDTTVAENKQWLIIMNLYPYNNGHIMVAPKVHSKMLDELQQEENTGLWEGVRIGVKIVKKSYQPDGINVGINMGRSAGAGITDHLHVHIVPRWNGDTNFMPVFSETKLISEYISKSVKRLRDAYLEVTGEEGI